ncbi:hypothetical protein E2I00_012359 [Balaenoptera physalus]|uniref:CD99 antigen-like protein 2 n=1 Tax=Balaenoptera physalus TaxID=9770 RepID=A0A643CD91_BALPH|nr:hypothetical protein E2I00_012359 [Balaenoptera physalus]
MGLGSLVLRAEHDSVIGGAFRVAIRIIHWDLISHEEMFSDIYTIQEVEDGLCLGVEGKMVCRTGGNIDDSFIRGNASTEGPEGEGTESTVITGVDIVMNHHLQETSFTKEAYEKYIKDYMKSIKGKLEEQRPERVKPFMTGAAEQIKHILANFKNDQFFIDENMNPDGVAALLDYSEDGSGDVGFSLEDALEETSSVKHGPFYYSDIFTDIKRNVASGWGAQTLLPSGNLLLVLKEHATMFLEVDSCLSSEETVMTQKSSKFDLADALDDQDHGHRKPSAGGGGPPEEKEFDLADALDDRNDQDHGHRKPNAGGGGFSDKDLEDLLGGGEYKPDKGKGDGQYGSGEDSGSGMSAETGTIAGVASALAMALIGAVSSYISYQQKKFCFSIQHAAEGQEGLSADYVKGEHLEAVVCEEPQVKYSALQTQSVEPPPPEPPRI